ncbi:MAG: hypothetical protein DRO67_00400 [Candidatus Asgardarchaeum californiense]|nr:MAG: hypothetical protein DRO67_00400 [Candidatus Asgardarchaeum californiense]
MDCACTVEVYIDDHCESLSNKFVKARKEHKCTECRRVIAIGEEYFREVTSYENSISTYKTCEDCYSIRQVFFSSGWCYGEVRENMEEFIWDCNGDVSVSCILMLTKPARDWVLDIIEEVYNNYED